MAEVINMDLDFQVEDGSEEIVFFETDNYAGPSAYEIAVKHGYEGTEEQWVRDIGTHVSKTSELTNNGDGTSPFATQQYVEEHRAADGTTDYEQLENKPKINGVELTGEIELVVPQSTSELVNDGNGTSLYATLDDVGRAIDAASESYVPKVVTKGNERLYHIKTNGEQGAIDLREDVAAYSVVKRGASGTVKVGEPVGDDDATTKKYVTDGFVEKVTTTGADRAYIITSIGSQGVIDIDVNPVAHRLAKRSVNGTLKVGTPAEDGDATTKNYVDANFRRIFTVGEGEYAYIADASGDGSLEIGGNPKAQTIAKRGSNGTLAVGTPNEDTHATTKKYVDELTASTKSYVDEQTTSTKSYVDEQTTSTKSYVDEQTTSTKDALQYQIDNIMTFLRSTVFTETTIEDSYSTRTTAQGLHIIDGAETKLLKVAGRTEASTNYLDLSQNAAPTSGTLNVKIVPTENSITFSGAPAGQVSFQVGRCYLPEGTYTLYVPQHNTSSGINWSVVENSGATPLVELNSTNGVPAVSFQITSSKYYYLYATVEATELSLTAQLAILGDDKTQDLPPKFPVYYEGFHHAGFRNITSTDAVGEKTSSVALNNTPETYELTMYDYIDFTGEIPIVYTWTVSQMYNSPEDVSTSNYISYVRDASGKYICGKYKSPQKQTENPYLAKTYIAYYGGTETVVFGEQELTPTITQIYYEKVGE